MFIRKVYFAPRFHTDCYNKVEVLSIPYTQKIDQNPKDRPKPKRSTETQVFEIALAHFCFANSCVV